MTPPDAAAILVNHDSGHRLGPLMDVLLPEVRSLTVVDNASTDGSVRAAEGRDRVRVIRNTDNRGFAAAVNQAAATIGDGDGEWLLLVNPDTHLRPGQVTALLEDVPSDVAAVAPVQVDEHGEPRSETGGYDPTLSRYLVWAALPVRAHGRRGPWLAPPFPADDADIDWVSGALLGIRRDVFEELGRFDERFFLYHEDVDFCRRARAAGYRVLVRPRVRLEHEVAHGDPRRRVASGMRSVESLALDFDGWRRRALGAILAAGYGARSVFARGTTRELARAVLPSTVTLMKGELPRRDQGLRNSA